MHPPNKHCMIQPEEYKNKSNIVLAIENLADLADNEWLNDRNK